MKTPKKIIIFGEAKMCRFRQTRKRYTTDVTMYRDEWAIGVTPDHKALVLFRIVYDPQAEIQTKRERGGTWHQIQKYKLENDQVKKIGQATQINYTSTRFQDAKNRPDEYAHQFTGKPEKTYLPDVYADSLANPTVFVIQYKPKRRIFSPGAKGSDAWPDLTVGAGII